MPQLDSPEAVYHAFFDRFNARDADGWAAVNAWPHARVSAADPDERIHWRPPTRIFNDAAEYVSAPLWDELASTGWARTEPLPPTIAQSSAVKAHLAGGWTRIDSQGREQASNRIVYVMTRSDDGWGMQAQLKTDSFDPNDDLADAQRAALDAVESALALLGARDVDAYAQALAYPFTLIGPPGVVFEIATPDDMAVAMRGAGDDALGASQGSARIVNCGRSGANVTFTVERDAVAQNALALVGQRGGVWRILAVSGI